MTGVETQPQKTWPRMPTWMFRPPFAMPMPMTAPMSACELDTGTSGIVGSPWDESHRSKPSDEKRKSTSA